MSAPAVAPAAATAARLAVRRYVPSDLPGIERLNRRFAEAGVHHRVFPEDASHEDRGLDPLRDLRERLFVAARGEEVHAGVFLREQPFRIGDATVGVGWTKYPVAESIIDRTLAAVPGALVMQLLREQPRLMALGLGGHGSPYAKLLGALRFTGSTVPFFVRPVRAGRVLRELPQLRTSPARRRAATLLGTTGLGAAALHLARVAGTVRHRIPRENGVEAHVEPAFAGWADEVWERCHREYRALAVRDERVLDPLYHESHDGLTRLRVARGGRTIGWAVLHRLDFRDRDASLFGRLALGVLMDVLASPADAAAVARAATDWLLRADVDLLISNQAHPAWQRALRAAGWLEAPSTMAFYRAPHAERLLAESGALEGGLHLTRGDGDGVGRF